MDSAPVRGDVKSILQLLEVMKELELALADFYGLCARNWEEDEAFWSGIRNQELQHASNLTRMEEIISKKQELFEAGRPLNVAAVKTFIEGIRMNVEKMRTRELPKKNVFFIARDYERSVIEDKYTEIVKTKDVEYQTLMKQIVAQTVNHKNRIERKIAELK